MNVILHKVITLRICYTIFYKVLLYSLLGYSLLFLDALSLSWGFYDSYHLSNHVVGVDYFLTAPYRETTLLYMGVQPQFHWEHQHLALGIGYREALLSKQYVGAYLFLNGTWDENEKLGFSNFNIGIEGRKENIFYTFNVYLPSGIRSGNKRIPFEEMSFTPTDNIIYKSQKYFIEEDIEYGIDWHFAYKLLHSYVLKGGTYYFQKNTPKQSILGGMLGMAYYIQPSLSLMAKTTYDSLSGLSFTVGFEFNPTQNALKRSALLIRMPSTFTRSASPITLQRKRSESMENCYFCIPDPEYYEKRPGLATFESPVLFTQGLVDQTPADAKFLLLKSLVNPLACYKLQDITLKPGQWIWGIPGIEGMSMPGDDRKPIIQFNHLTLNSKNKLMDVELWHSPQKGIQEAITLKGAYDVEIEDVNLYTESSTFYDRKFTSIGLHDASLDLRTVSINLQNTNFFSKMMLYGVSSTSQDPLKMANVTIRLETYSDKDQLIPLSKVGLTLNDYKKETEIIKNRFELVQPKLSLCTDLQRTTSNIESENHSVEYLLETPAEELYSQDELKLQQMQLLDKINQSREKVRLLLPIIRAQRNKTKSIHALQVELEKVLGSQMASSDFLFNSPKGQVARLRSERNKLKEILSKSPIIIDMRDNHYNRSYALYTLVNTIEYREEKKQRSDNLSPLDEQTKQHIDMLEPKLKELKKCIQKGDEGSFLKTLEAKVGLAH
jgi:hypothetical protein